MNLALYRFYEEYSGANILIALAIMFVAGFLLSRITKLCRLPNVTGYILAGILIGPFLLDLIPHTIIDNMSFLSDLALGFIAFSVGKFFKKDVLKRSGKKVLIITLMESLLAGALVTIFVGLIFPDLGWNFALLLGAIATATAPASTLMTIKQYDAKGELVDVLLQVVALDDVVCLLCFTLISAIVEGTSQNGVQVETILLPIAYNLLLIFLGFIFGFLLSLFIRHRSSNSKLIFAVALIALLAGIGILLDVSPLLACMVFGAIYCNVSHDEKLFKYVDHFTPPLMLLFFVLSGMNMDFSSFMTIGIVGVLYFVIRLLGKYFGAYLGVLMAKGEKSTRNYLGLALAPQAGVAIGLAFLGERILPASMGGTFLSIILTSSVLYEMAGPALAKLALFKSGAITLSKKEIKKIDESDKQLPAVIYMLPLVEETKIEETKHDESQDWRHRSSYSSYLLARKAHKK